MKKDELNLKTLIGSRIYSLRKNLNLTQKEFIEKLFISKGHFSRIESGFNIPSAELIREISINYNVSSDYLLDITVSEIILESEKELIKEYRTLSKESKETIKSLIHILHNEKK